MTKAHAFQRRDEFTCTECFYFSPQDRRPYCKRRNAPIHYNPAEFGCGEFGCDDDRKAYDTTLGMFL